jgi:hypothetical protein
VNLTLSPQMKIVALVGALAVLALGAGSMMLGRNQPTSSAAVPNVPLKHFHPKAVAPLAPAKSTGKAPAAPAQKVTTHAAAPASALPKIAKPVVVPKAKPVAEPAVAANGLPSALDLLLHGHRVVVVALYDPEIPSDQFALLEARAGAKAANAGFFAVSILDERVAGPLTTLVGNGTVLPSPSVLIYKQPSTLMNRIDGFSDRDAIAEAVANALIADTPPQGVTPAPAAPAAPAVTAPPATTTVP